MANIKSQIKRNKQNKKARVRNRVFRGAARTSIKKANVAIKTGDEKEAKELTLKAIKALDAAAQKALFIRIMRRAENHVLNEKAKQHRSIILLDLLII